jgi:serine/threonine protein kinase
VVKFLGATYEPNPRIRIQYVAGGSLSDHLRTHARFSAHECAQVAEQGLSFLSYLHGLVPIVVHRDIGLNNILLEFRHRGKVSIKFADFGLAKEGQQLDTICGNLLYLAPEIYNQRRLYPFGNKCDDPYTQTVDIWSFGVVLVQIICGLPTWRKEYEHMGIVWSQKI